MELKKCTKCDGEMEEGFILSPQAGRWKKGKPTSINKWLGGLIFRSVWITVYRCKNCGYLESYAK